MTAMCLLFERVHILDHLEYILDAAARMSFPEAVTQTIEGRVASLELSDKAGIFLDLTPRQLSVAKAYLLLTAGFIGRYEPLFGKVLTSSLIRVGEKPRAEGKTFSVLVEAGDPESKRVDVSRQFFVRAGGLTGLDDLLSRGAVPVLDRPRLDKVSDGKAPSARYLASLLAMRSLELVLPQTKPADCQTILEARERLKDYLPPFWASMLRLSAVFQDRLTEGASDLDLARECQDIVDTTVRPALIDLNQKLLKDRRRWFHKIMGPVGKNLRILGGRPPVTTADLVSAGLAFGANVAIDVGQQMSKKNVVPKEAGLIFLIELEKVTQGRKP